MSYSTDLCLCSLLQESDYFTDRGEFRVDSQGSSTLLNCLMYKLSYYRFGELKVGAKSWVLCGGAGMCDTEA